MAKNGRPIEERNIHEVDKRVRKDIRIGKSKDKYEETDLPSPPPDPWSSPSCTQPAQSPSAEPPREEDDIIAYLAGIRTPPCDSRNSDCLSRNSATSTMAVTSLYTEESFEQLDRLYDMAEQILELRDRSSKLFRRVRELERLKVLRTADLRAERAIFANEDISSDLPDEDAGFAESLLDAIISSSRDSQLQRRNPRSPYSRQRSHSLAVSEQSLPRSPNLGNRSSLGIEKTTFRNEASGAPKVSKWTRVKAAFKWERACPNDVTDSNVEQTPTTPTTPTTKYLRIPDISSGSWSGSILSPSTGELSAPSTPIGRPSSASSSNEDVFDRQRKNLSEPADRRISRAKEGSKKNESTVRSQSPENDTTVTTNDDAMQYASEINQSKPLIRITTESTPEPQIETFDSKSSSNVEKDTEITLKKPTPILTITIPSNEEEFRNASSPESTSPLPSSTLDSGQSSPHRAKIRQGGHTLAEFKRQRSIMEESSAPKIQRMDSKWNKVRRAFLSNAAFSVPPSPVRVIGRQSFLQDESETPRARSCSGSVDDLTKNSLMSNNQLETRRDYQALREKLGAEFHQKLIEWERLKRSTGGNTRSTRDTFASSNGTTPSSPHESLLLTEDRLDPEFKKKLQEWKLSKKGRRGSASIEPQRVNRRRLTDWQLWRSPSKPETKNQELMEPRRSCGSVGSTGSVGSDCKPNLCEDFVRRMEAWRRLSEASRRSSSARLGVNSDTVDETEFMTLDRVLTIFGNLGQEIHQNGDWLEQSSKLAEKSRSFKSGNEILIRTSVGSYRFEGISQEFTRKLYDWEKYRGISPRSSTFRLLGPAYAPFVGTVDESTTTVTPAAGDEEVFLGGIKRSKSVGSIVEASERTEPFIRRSASLHSLDYLAEKLEDTDLMADSSAPVDSERRPDTSEDVNMDDSEPEAMIVDIEDVIEETASPLRRVQPHQTPVYSVAASETTSIAVPLGTVTSSHEPSPAILMKNEDNSDREHWESRNWNLRSDHSNQDSPASGKWLSSWNGLVDFSERNKTNLEFGEYWRRRPDRDDEDTPGQETWKFGGWDRTSKYSSKDDESIKSDRSLESMQNDRSLDGNEEDCNRESLKSEVLDLHSGDNNNVDVNETSTSNDEGAEDTTMHRASKSEGFLTKTMERTEETMELPSENNEEQRSEREELKKDEDEKDIDERNDGKNEILNETERIPSIFYHRRPVNVPTVDNAGIFSTSSTLPLESGSRFFRNNAVATSIADKEQNIADEFDKNRRMFQLHQYTDFATMRFSHDFTRSTITSNQYDKNETQNSETSKKKEISRENASVVEKIEGTRKTEQRQYRSFERISTTSSKNGTMEYREPTIRTTPLTVSTHRESRYVERIIINEETLKKIVVPTASSDSSNGSFSKKDEPLNTLHDRCAFEGSRKDNNEPPLERGSYVVNQNTNNGERAKQRAESASRNVFVKTKRMIFSPFRRVDDRRVSREADADETSSDRAERRKSKSISKSRSASPRTLRHDVLPRMPLSLPWPLRSSSSKDSETKDDTRVEGRGEERSWFQKYHRRTRSREERAVQQNEIIIEREEEKVTTEKVEEKEIAEKKDEECKKLYRDPVDDGYEEIIVREIEQDHRLPVTPNIGKEEEEDKIECSSISDTLPSDLMHKLRILSNAAAKRDGRISSCIDTMTIESRSSRIQRAKEGFLSRRGGPLCQSMLEPSTPVSSGQDGEPPFTGNHKASTLKNEDSISEDKSRDTTDDFSYPTPPTSAPQSPNLSKDSNSKSDLVKSASAGMINVDPDTFGRLATTDRGCESLPRTISKRRDSGGPLTRIVNKLRLSRLMRSKDNGDRNMSTISTLCRQSLLIDVHPDLEENREHENRSDKDEEEDRKEHRYRAEVSKVNTVECVRFIFKRYFRTFLMLDGETFGVINDVEEHRDFNRSRFYFDDTFRSRFKVSLRSSWKKRKRLSRL
ncbi:hypothetical protein KPH14_011062 [Odynerus spinipes]|uniref:Uncharacterized protein n=1 Tax=Odynerus spinipes TaxID=1348599 RepID=A0AAD9RHS1_9HYME|nr:hypothetical protein KPH14_011062 [Odynerus spinipes]